MKQFFTYNLWRENSNCKILETNSFRARETHRIIMPIISSINILSKEPPHTNDLTKICYKTKICTDYENYKSSQLLVSTDLLIQILVHVYYKHALYAHCTRFGFVANGSHDCETTLLPLCAI